MSEHRAAYRYARALMDLAVEKNKVDAVHRDMRTILDTIQENDNLKDVLQSPILTGGDKKDALEAIFKGSDPLTIQLFKLLTDNKRVGILNEVAGQYIRLYEQMQGQEVATVTTAVPLNNALEEKILKRLRAVTGKEVVIENEVDPDLIGGFMLRLGDLEYNASIQNKLSSLKRELLKN